MLCLELNSSKTERVQPQCPLIKKDIAVTVFVENITLVILCIAECACVLVSVYMFICASVGVSDQVCVCVRSCVVCMCVFYHVCLCVQGMFFYYLLGLIWVTQFIIGCERLTISGAVALWFFTR